MSFLFVIQFLLMCVISSYHTSGLLCNFGLRLDSHLSQVVLHTCEARVGSCRPICLLHHGGSGPKGTGWWAEGLDVGSYNEAALFFWNSAFGQYVFALPLAQFVFGTDFSWRRANTFSSLWNHCQRSSGFETFFPFTHFPWFLLQSGICSLSNIAMLKWFVCIQNCDRPQRRKLCLEFRVVCFLCLVWLVLGLASAPDHWTNKANCSIDDGEVIHVNNHEMKKEQERNGANAHFLLVLLALPVSNPDSIVPAVCNLFCASLEK